MAETEFNLLDEPWIRVMTKDYEIKEVEYQIKSSAWMDDEVRDIILDKLVYMNKKIGYPSSYRNITVMKEHFRGVRLSYIF